MIFVIGSTDNMNWNPAHRINPDNLDPHFLPSPVLRYSFHKLDPAPKILGKSILYYFPLKTFYDPYQAS